MAEIAETAILFDVDNTLLDNDRIIADLGDHLAECYGETTRDRFWEIFERRRAELGYADYLGALEQFRLEAMHHPKLLRMANWLVDYPFHERIYNGAFEAIAHAKGFGVVSILSDGDAVFQPRKVERSGLWRVFGDNVLIYVHKELELLDVEAHLPAKRYILVDDKIHILAAVKEAWGGRVTTVFPRQGHYAADPVLLARYPAADITIETIGDLVRHDLAAMAHR